MKWGIRRYQNKDGTLTAAGKKRYDRDVRENNAKKKENRIIIDSPDPKRWAGEDLARAKKTVDASQNLVREVRNVNKQLNFSSNKPVNLDSMTEQDLRKAINRAVLERQYTELYGSSQVSNGKDFVDNILDKAGAVLGLGGSALGIALAIKQLLG